VPFNFRPLRSEYWIPVWFAVGEQLAATFLRIELALLRRASKRRNFGSNSKYLPKD
jgi:hypothetical protein